MSTAKTARITVELETGADPIRGLIEHADGNRQPLWGWLELIEAVRRAAADQLNGHAQPNAGETGQLGRPNARAGRRKPHTSGEE